MSTATSSCCVPRPKHIILKNLKSEAQPMYFANPFSLPGRWFKGILHVHSTASDGDRSPAEVMDWYRSRGYHFLALTDHDVLSKPETLADDFITLGGIEVEGLDPRSGLYHLVGLGPQHAPDIGVMQRLPLQTAIDRLRAVGSLVSLAHPYWSGQRSGDLLAMQGCFALEVYNGGCEVDDCKGYSNVHWDDLLAAGRRLWGLAVDDAHWRRGASDAGLGWVWVKAPALTAEAILQALKEGLFYASSGPEIQDVQLEGDEIQVRCSPVAAVDFVGNGPYSRRISAPRGGTLTTASHKRHEQQGYVRVACRDLEGRQAWSNPIFFDAGQVA
jgi:hypothetical protein